MHPQTLFSMLDRLLQPKTRDPHVHGPLPTEFSLGAAPACRFLEAQVFEQLCAGCGGHGELSAIVMALGPEVLWGYVQCGLGKILHCTRGGGLRVQIDCDPSHTFFELRRRAIYSMAGHLTELN